MVEASNTFGAGIRPGAEAARSVSSSSSATRSRLLDDIRARKIDVIVVYKVDRLTRSLADFAKLVELFDAQGVSWRPAADGRGKG